MLTVGDAARALGITPPRVRQLLTSGGLAGRKSGGTWLVESESVFERLQLQQRSATRPLGYRMLCFLLHWLNENPILAPMDPTERRRLESYIARLDRTPNPAALLRYWVGPHDKMVRKRYVGNVADLLEDPRLRITGFSAEQAGLESNRQVDLRVWNAHASELVTEYLLVDDPQPNVYLHDSFSADVEPGLGTLLIDLSAHGRSREDEAVRRILRSR